MYGLQAIYYEPICEKMFPEKKETETAYSSMEPVSAQIITMPLSVAKK